MKKILITDESGDVEYVYIIHDADNSDLSVFVDSALEEHEYSSCDDCDDWHHVSNLVEVPKARLLCTKCFEERKQITNQMKENKT